MMGQRPLGNAQTPEAPTTDFILPGFFQGVK